MATKSRNAPRPRPALSPDARARIIWGGGSAALTVVLVLLWSNLSSPVPPVVPTIPHTYAAGDSQFVRVMSSLLGPPMVGGNRVRTLLNGDQIFPAMLGPSAAPKRTIDFETYIYWSGEIGREFADALSERARAGVQGRTCCSTGSAASKMDQAVLRPRCDGAGVEIVTYHPLRWYNLDRINNRTHRKLLVVDGRVGFTGGVGIADQWTGPRPGPGPLARHPLPRRRAGGGADAGRVHGQLDRRPTGQVLHGDGLLPAARAGRRPGWRRCSRSSPERAAARACS